MESFRSENLPPGEGSLEEVESGFQRTIQKVREGLKASITESLDVQSFFRSTVIRPFRRMPDPMKADAKLNSAEDFVLQFCIKVGERYPTTIEAKRALLEKLDDERFLETVRAHYP